MLAESLIALAQLAGLTVVAAAVTDSWEAARRGFARVLGRGDLNKEQLAELRLEETREQLTGAQGAELEQVRAALAERWAGRLADLLEEHPDAEPNLRALVEKIQAALPAGAVTAADHSLAAGGDMTISGNVSIADRGGVVAGEVHGSISTNPPTPDPAKG